MHVIFGDFLIGKSQPVFSIASKTNQTRFFQYLTHYPAELLVLLVTQKIIIFGPLQTNGLY